VSRRRCWKGRRALATAPPPAGPPNVSLIAAISILAVANIAMLVADIRATLRAAVRDMDAEWTRENDGIRDASRSAV